MWITAFQVLSGHAPRYRGIIHAFSSLYRQGGVRGLYTGWVPSCQRAALVQLGDLTTYDYAKRSILANTSLTDGPRVHALSSACAGLVAATLGAPSDLIKTRYMNQPMAPDGVTGLHYRSALDCLQKTVKSEGVLALWKGWLPTWLRMAPWSFSYLTFEQLRKATGQSSF